MPSASHTQKLCSTVFLEDCDLSGLIFVSGLFFLPRLTLHPHPTPPPFLSCSDYRGQLEVWAAQPAEDSVSLREQQRCLLPAVWRRQNHQRPPRQLHQGVCVCVGGFGLTRYLCICGWQNCSPLALRPILTSAFVICIALRLYKNILTLSDCTPTTRQVYSLNLTLWSMHVKCVCGSEMQCFTVVQI